MFFRHIFASLLMLLATYSYADDSMMFSELEFPNTDGDTVNMTDYKGKVVLLNFWATWCPPCVKEMPSMQRLKERYADDGFEIVAINAGEEPDVVDAFLLQLDTELTFPILLDQKGVSFIALGIKGLPMSFLLNKEGRSVMTFMGGREWDEKAQTDLIEAELAK